MGFVSKYNIKFLTFMNRKYKKYDVKFEFYDDYILWLYDICLKNDILYYKCLEEDFKEYVECQSGKEREKRGKLNGNWEKD